MVIMLSTVYGVARSTGTSSDAVQAGEGVETGV